MALQFHILWDWTFKLFQSRQHLGPNLDRHIQLEGDHDADQGYAGEIISPSWPDVLLREQEEVAEERQGWASPGPT